MVMMEQTQTKPPDAQQASPWSQSDSLHRRAQVCAEQSHCEVRMSAVMSEACPRHRLRGRAKGSYSDQPAHRKLRGAYAEVAPILISV